MARPRKELEEKTQKRLERFAPSIMGWYEEVFRERPKGFTQKDWYYLKYHISKVCLNKIIPDRKQIEGGENPIKISPIIIKISKK